MSGSMPVCVQDFLYRRKHRLREPVVEGCLREIENSVHEELAKATRGFFMSWLGDERYDQCTQVCSRRTLFCN